MRHDPLHVLLAVVLLVALLWLPGLALARLLLPTRSRVLLLAVAPAVSAGVLYALGEALSAADVPVDGRLALGTCLAALAVLVILERRDPVLRGPLRCPPALPAAWLLGTATWALGIRDLLAVPPHNDGYNHGYFVANVAQFASLDPSEVLRHDVLSPEDDGLGYYPLALHQLAAVLVRALDLDVALAWTLVSLGVTVLVLPLGALALGRWLLPDRPGYAAACCLVAAAVPGVTYSTSWWGGFALAAGLAVTPGALLCLAHAVEGRAWRPVALSATALAGVAGVHTSEVTFLAVVAGVVLVAPWAVRRAWGEAARRAAVLLACGVGSLVLLAPAVAQVRRGAAERAYPLPDPRPLGRTLLEPLVQFSFVPPSTPGAVVVAGWVGLVLAARQPRMRPWLAAWGVFWVLYVWLGAFPSQLVDTLTASWYSDRFRLAYLQSFLMIPMVALALTARPALRAGRALPLVLGAVLLATSTADSVRAIRQNYDDFSVVGSDERSAFAFLAEHTRPGERVLDQRQDGGPWLYSLTGVPVVVAMKPFDLDAPYFADARYLAEHAAEAGRDPRVDALLDALQVRYVFVGGRVFPTDDPELDPEALSTAPGLALVFRRGATRVFEVLP